MSYYSRIRVGVEASQYSDYGSPDSAGYEYAGTPNMWEVNKLVSVGTAATEAIDTIVSYAAGVVTMVIKNEGVYPVNLTWSATNYAAGANTNTMEIPAGQVAVLTEVTMTTNPTLRAHTGASLCRITILGT